jgi:glucose-induced degradation protein 8
VFFSVTATLTRVQIREIVQQGDITKAIEETNLVAPETLDAHREVFFRLNTQRLIELIRVGNIPAALDFARAELADLAEENQQFLDWLEEAMALLAFPDSQT